MKASINSMYPIICYLKIRNRGNLHFVLKSLNFWLSAFSNKKKYSIIIYNEDVDLGKEYFDHYTVINKQTLLNDIECKKLYDIIQASNIIAPHWRPAAAALTLLYTYIKDSELVYNIDSDDIILYSPHIKNYLAKIENLFDDPKMITISHDLHFSTHQGDYFSFRPFHWTMGVNLSRTKKMKQLIYKALFNPNIPEAPWKNNIDYLIDLQLEKLDTPYVCFITKNLLRHYWQANANYDEHCKGMRFNKDLNKIESELAGQHILIDKHPRTILIE